MKNISKMVLLRYISYFFFFAAFVLMIIIISKNFYKISIKSFGSVLEPVSITVNFAESKKRNFLICLDDYCTTMTATKHHNSYIYKYSQDDLKDKFNFKVFKNISLIWFDDNENIKSTIENIYLFIGHRNYFYNKDDISKISLTSGEMQFDNANTSSKCKILKLPNNFKSNYSGIFNHIVLLFLFLFYGWKKLILCYLFLFIGYILNPFPIRKFINKNVWAILILLLLINLFLRLNNLFYYPLWADELYTKTIAIKSLLNCFSDPGNPPAFYVFEYIISKIINDSDFVLKISSLIIGVLFPMSVYFLFKKSDKTLGIFACFFASINTVAIYHCQELRSIGLCSLIVTLLTIYLFNYISDSSKKNLFIYFILSVIAVNLHYYCSILVFCNSLYGIIMLKQKGDKLKFLLTSFISCLCLLPYLIISFNKALDPNFNGWVGEFNLYQFSGTINVFFKYKAIFFILALFVALNLILVFLSKKNRLNIKIDKFKSDLLLYLVYSIFAVTIVISLISVLIKPIFYSRLFISLYSLLIMFHILIISSVVDFNKTGRKFLFIKGFISLLLFFMILDSLNPIKTNRIRTIDDYIKFISYDAPKYLNQGYEIHGVLTDYVDYLSYFKNFPYQKIHWHTLDANQGYYLIDFDKEDFSHSKKVVIYLNDIGIMLYNAIEFKQNSYVVETNTITCSKTVYDE